MQKQPLLILLIFCIVGIIIAEYFPKMIPSGYVLLVVIFLLLVFLYLFRIRFAWLKGLVFGGILFLLFAYFHSYNSRYIDSIDFIGKQKFYFQLIKKLNSTEKYKKYEVEVMDIEKESKNSNFKCIVNIDSKYPNLDFHHMYYAEAYINKMKSTTHDFQFDYTKYLARQGIYYQSFLKDYDIVGTRKHLSVLEKVKQYRHNLLARIDDSQLRPTVKSFLKGIILADRTDMEGSMITDFRRTGLIHLLAISGGHMVVIFGLVFFILKKGFYFLRYRERVLISLLVVWLFTILIDFGNSVVRSSLMLSFYYISVLMQRQANLLHSASLSALVMLSFDTQNLFDIGFQLSYLAVLGIALFHNPICNILYKGNVVWKKWFSSIIGITISAQLGTFPIILYNFHQYSLGGFLFNIIIVPISEILIVLSCFMVLLYALDIVFNEIEILYDLVISFVLDVIHYMASLDMLYVEQISFGIFELLAIFIVLYFVYRWLSVYYSSPFLCIFSLLMFFIIHFSVNEYWVRKQEFIEVEMFDDKIFIVKNRENAVVFVPEKKNNEKDSIRVQQFVVNPYKLHRRLDKVDIVYYDAAGTKEIMLGNGKAIKIK